MTRRDGGFDYEDGCPDCGAGVREDGGGAVCKGGCGWTTAPPRRVPADPGLVRKYAAEIDRLYVRGGTSVNAKD